jgi:hypothetical protein
LFTYFILTSALPLPLLPLISQEQRDGLHKATIIQMIIQMTTFNPLIASLCPKAYAPLAFCPARAIITMTMEGRGVKSKGGNGGIILILLKPIYFFFTFFRE